jgi:hypothetical protein
MAKGGLYLKYSKNEDDKVLDIDFGTNLNLDEKIISFYGRKRTALFLVTLNSIIYINAKTLKAISQRM